MGSFLSVSHGSAENPVFLEMSYNNTGHLILPCHEKSNELHIFLIFKAKNSNISIGIYYLAFASNRFAMLAELNLNSVLANKLQNYLAKLAKITWENSKEKLQEKIN